MCLYCVAFSVNANTLVLRWVLYGIVCLCLGNAFFLPRGNNLDPRVGVDLFNSGTRIFSGTFIRFNA